MRRWCAVLALSGWLASWAAGAPILHYEFENGLATWDKVGNAQPLTIQTKVAHAGQALECRYTVDRANPYAGPGVLVAPRLAEAKAVRFWLRTDHLAAIAVILKETGGARYQALITSPPDTWSHVDLSIDRFRLAPDSKDDNNQLDLDQVTWLGVMDITRTMPSIKAEDGPRILWLDEFSVDNDASKSAYSPDGKLPYLLDTFTDGFIPWVAFDGTLALAPKDGALVWQYPGDKADGANNFMFTSLGPLPAKGATHLLVTLSSTRATQIYLVLQTEPRGGQDQQRFSAVIGVPASPTPKTYTLALKDFHQVTNTGPGDDARHLDLSQVATLVLGDLEVMNGQQPGPNKIFLDEIQLFAAKS
jgi:hypothetical protein